VRLAVVRAGLRTGWWLAVVGAVSGGSVALAVGALQPSVYSSSTQLFVVADVTSSDGVAAGGRLADERVATYVQLLEGRELAARVVDRLDLSDTPDEVASRVRATTAAGSALIDVAVQDGSPVGAQQLANAVGQEFIGLVQSLEGSSPTNSSPVTVQVTERAGAPDTALSPQKGPGLLAGVLVGALFGGLVAGARGRLDGRVGDPEDAARLARAPVVGIVPVDEVLARESVTSGVEPVRAAEALGQLRTNLQFLDVDDPPAVVLVTSAGPGEGKTTVAVQLALSMAATGRRVVLVDADLRRPRVTSRLGLVGGAGLSDVLAGRAALDDVLQPYGEDKFSVLGSGAAPPTPGGLLASAAMAGLLAELRRRNDMVLIDGAPLLPVADARGLAALVDGVLICVRHGRTKENNLVEARAALDRVGARTLAVVLNATPPVRQRERPHPHP
jgi:receptor protein-tyrosine kinase